MKNEEDLWTLGRGKDFFDEYDLQGKGLVSYLHVPFTVGGSDVRRIGGGSPQYERLDIILPIYADSSRMERDLRSELDQQGDLNRFAEALAAEDQSLDAVFEVTENGGQFAPEGFEDIKDPRLTLEENDEEYVNLRGDDYSDHDIEIPRAVKILEKK